MVNFTYDEVNKQYRPSLYPGEDPKDWSVPDSINHDFNRLNSIIENKYSREFLKICAFYNKMLPTLKSADWIQSSYNVPAFTAIDQERSDTGTGFNFNYLKQIVDQITSRLGTVTFLPMLQSEDQSFEYVVYKDEVERILRMFIKNHKFNRACLEAFHNSAIVGYSHCFIDPFTSKLQKAADYEIGMYESQFNRDSVVQMLYRDYMFPATSVPDYLETCDDAQKKEILESCSNKAAVDFKMYFDCAEHKVWVTIGGKTLPPKDYPFDEVLMSTMSWDTGVKNAVGTSEFDLLYPIQREINRFAAKQQQMIRMYKGPTPVFNNDVDLAMKTISNGTGEALYVDSTRPIDSLMAVINPTPLDPQMSAEIQNYKTTMYELAGIQNASFDMENMRSAAAVVALDQTRDAVFQAQMSAFADYVRDSIMLYIRYFAVYPDKAISNRASVDWESIASLIDRSYINLVPIHVNDMLSDEEDAKQEPTDFIALSVARVTLDILKGNVTFDTLPYYLDPMEVTKAIAGLLIKFEALGITVPAQVHKFLISAFVYAVQNGDVKLY